jgi:hypothetical protein
MDILAMDTNRHIIMGIMVNIPTPTIKIIPTVHPVRIQNMVLLIEVEVVAILNQIDKALHPKPLHDRISRTSVGHRKRVPEVASRLVKDCLNHLAEKIWPTMDLT